MLNSMLKQGLPIQESLVDEIKPVKEDCKFGLTPRFQKTTEELGRQQRYPARKSV